MAKPRTHKTPTTQPLTYEEHKPITRPLMTHEEFEKLLKISVSNDISLNLVGKDLSQVIPDAEALDNALAKIPKKQWTKTLQAIGKKYLSTLFDSSKNWLTSESAARVFVFIINQQLLILNQCIKTQDDVVNFLTLITHQKNGWDLLTRQLSYETRRQFFAGKGTLSNFLEQFKGDANLFVALFTDHDALRENRPGNLTGNLGNMNECLKRITDPALRLSFIKSLEYHPDYLDDFKDDEELALVLGELLNPKDFANVLLKCSDRLAARPNVVPMLIKNRMNDMEIATVLISKYLKVVPANLWIENWKVIANHLTKNASSSDIFLNFDENTSKEVLDSYENLIKILKPIVTKHQAYQNWVNTLLLPQGGWKFLGEVCDNIEKGAERDRSVLGLESSAASFGVLFILPIVAIISLLGVIPALVAGAIHLAKVKPAKAEIEMHLKGFPGIEATDLIKGYERQKSFHETLKREDKKHGLFHGTVAKKPDDPLIDSPDYRYN